MVTYSSTSSGATATEDTLFQLHQALAGNPVYRRQGLRPLSDCCVYRIKLTSSFTAAGSRPLIKPSVKISFQRLRKTHSNVPLREGVTLEPGEATYETKEATILSLRSNGNTIDVELEPCIQLDHLPAAPWHLLLEFPIGLVEILPSDAVF